MSSSTSAIETGDITGETSISSSSDSETLQEEEEKIFIEVDSSKTKQVKDESKKISTLSTSKLKWLLNLKWSRKSPNKIYLLLYNLIMPFVVITTSGLFAYLFNLPFIFPSLGPTAFLHFAIPNKAPSSPKNTLIGHFIGIIAGSASLQITNLYSNDNIFAEGVEFKRIWCSSLSVGICCVLMILLKVEHPPAAASTLIVSLGILKTPIQLTMMMSAVLLITIEAFIINRCLRKDAIYPIWSVNENNNDDDDDEYDEDKDKMMISLKGYSKMRLSRMNDDWVKLQNMSKHLCVDNFLEYFEICKDLESDQDMVLLYEFAKKNKESLLKIKNYTKQIPYSMQVFINHC